MEYSNPTIMWKDRRTRSGTREVHVLGLAKVRWKGTGKK